MTCIMLENNNNSKVCRWKLDSFTNVNTSVEREDIPIAEFGLIVSPPFPHDHAT